MQPFTEILISINTFKVDIFNFTILSKASFRPVYVKATGHYTVLCMLLETMTTRTHPLFCLFLIVSLYSKIAEAQNIYSYNLYAKQRNKVHTIVNKMCISVLFHGTLHGPSMFAVKAKCMECSIINPALSLLMKNLAIGQRQKAPNFSAFHWSLHGSLVSIGQYCVTTRVVHLPKRTETNLITESDRSGLNHRVGPGCAGRA